MQYVTVAEARCLDIGSATGSLLYGAYNYDFPAEQIQGSVQHWA